VAPRVVRCVGLGGGVVVGWRRADRVVWGMTGGDVTVLVGGVGAGSTTVGAAGGGVGVVGGAGAC